ncbi:MAG: class I SAM-dependent methyltransferase [Gammaproteobacteria bacterium]|nr:class I SAM-dependent methyltransferase [Gammaproteobacteria bacterium]
MINLVVIFPIGIRLSAIGVIVFEPVTFFVGFVLTQGARNFGIRKLLPYVLQMAHDIGEGPNRTFLDDLCVEELQRTAKTLRGFVAGGYKPDPPEAMASFFERFFRAAEAGKYIGVDSHLPSDYIRKYDWYLRIHAGYSPRGDVRVLVADQNALATDYLDYDQFWSDFIQWHADHGVELRWIDASKAELLRSRHDLPTTDLGLWPNQAVLFKPDDEGNPSLTTVFRDDPARRPGLAAVQTYVGEVVRDSKTFEEGAPPGIEVMNEELARKWEQYVDSDARLDPAGPLATFLLRELAGCRLVLDAAAGLGCESVLLMRQGGIGVVSNEIDARLRTVASDFAKKRGVELDLRKNYWERLSSSLPGNLRFDAVLVLGNSICLTLQAARRQAALRNLFDVLNPDGRLIIDERNFQFMLDRRDAILDDPYTNFPPARGGDVMYRGSLVRAYPAGINDELVTWRFVKNEPRIANAADLKSSGRQLGRDMQLHPFRRGELYQALRESGFAGEIRVFADLEFVATTLSGDPMPDVGEPAFITYVASRANIKSGDLPSATRVPAS